MMPNNPLIYSFVKDGSFAKFCHFGVCANSKKNYGGMGHDNDFTCLSIQHKE